MITPVTPRGFTLVETLVAIAILMIATVAPFFMLQQAITSSFAARDQLIASALAQEGVEYVYFVRHNNYLRGRAWNFGLGGCAIAAGCAVDPAESAISSCPSGGCAPLRLSATGLYTQTGTGEPTRFTRTVFIRDATTNGVPQLKVTVRVTWTSGRVPYSLEIVEDLYNWL